MNDVQSLIDRQLGIYSRLNYDNVLKRLVVEEGESYYGLVGANVMPSFDQDPPIFACRFAEVAGYEHILALANEDGRVAIQNTTSARTAQTLEGYQCHNNAVFDLAWMPGKMSFVTVSGDHSVCVWDVGGGATRCVAVCAAHTRSVKVCVFRAPPAAPHVLATGGRDGHVLVWDLRAAGPQQALRPDNWLASCHSGAAPPSHGKRARLDAPRAVSVTGLAFRDDNTLLSCGECDGSIKVWDLRKNYSACKREPLPKHSIPYCGGSTRCGYTNLAVDESRTRLYASCMDSVIYCFNVATCSALPEQRYVGHESGTFYIKTGLSADGRYLVSGSSDKRAYVWSVGRPQPLVRLEGHRAEVTCAAWGPRDLKLVTCSDDARHMIWRVGPELLRERERLQGWAEPAPHSEPAPAVWGTPSTLRRRADTTPGSRSSKRARPAPPPARRTKRCLAAMLDAPDADAAKRMRLTPAESGAPASAPRPAPAECDAPGSAPRPASKRARAATPPPEEAPPECHYTPTKRARAAGGSPRVVSWRTPTKDLPDWVLRGEAPHLRLMSPPRRKPDTPDWLTLLSRARRPPPPALVGSPPRPGSPKENVPPRRNSATEKTPKSATKSKTLLKYFTVKEK